MESSIWNLEANGTLELEESSWTDAGETLGWFFRAEIGFSLIPIPFLLKPNLLVLDHDCIIKLAP